MKREYDRIKEEVQESLNQANDIMADSEVH